MATEILLTFLGVVSILLLSGEFGRCAFFDEVLKYAKAGGAMSCIVNTALSIAILSMMLTIGKKKPL